MGLDMYLEAEVFLSEMSDKDNQYEAIRSLFPEIKDTGNLNYVKVKFEVGYWRKANHIHKWFVDNIQDGNDDCNEYYVGKDQLEELKNLCKEVLENRSKASSLLPTTGGFFFGGTDYDDYYFQDLEHTIAVVDYCLSLPDYFMLSYRASW